MSAPYRQHVLAEASTRALVAYGLGSRFGAETSRSLMLFIDRCLAPERGEARG